MRAVKSLLVMAGALKRADTKESEDVVLIRAMKDSNIPKFLKDDIPLFEALVQDLFPNVKIKEIRNEMLEENISETLIQNRLQPTPKFINKVVQLFDIFNVRFGVMLVGQTGTGKTTCYKILA
jgi:dynein heavy chain